LVSRQALISRINRRLAKTNEKLVTTRTGPARIDLGRYYVVDTSTHHGANRMHVDLEALARELGVLRENETVAQ
jgi:hypothetical protein